MSLKFISLSSGSSGNSYYLGNDRVSFIIDAGIGVRTIKKRLAEYNVDAGKVDFILVTHDHSDHIRHLAALSERLMKPVVATQKLFNSIEVHPHTLGGVKSFRKIIEKEKPYHFKGISVTAFEVPHDATENLGYYIDFLGERFTIVTDLGHVTQKVIDFCRISNHVVIESNYDCGMLEGGKYPRYLIDRIRGGLGHLSNDETAAAIRLMYHQSLRNIFLCHLSDNNNTPELAYNTSHNVLRQLGVSPGNNLNLYCLPRKSHRCHIL